MAAKKSPASHAKPKMPEDGIMLDGGFIRVKMSCDLERFNNGGMHMTMEGGVISEDGKKIGTFANVIPAGVQVVLGSRHYYFSIDSLVQAARHADAEYLGQCSAGKFGLSA